MELKERIARKLYATDHDSNLDYVQVEGFFLGLAEAILPIIEDIKFLSFHEGYGKGLKAGVEVHIQEGK